MTAPRTTAIPEPSRSSLTQELRGAIDDYYAALTAAANDPAANTAALERLIDPSCACRAVLRLLREEAAKGHRLDYTYSVDNLRVIEVTPRGGVALYQVVQSAGHQRDQNGRVLARYPGSRQKFSAEFGREDGRWLLRRANQVK